MSNSLCYIVTHNNKDYAAWENPYRISGPYTGNNFGMLVINWEAQPAPEIIMRVVGLDGRSVLERAVSLAGLQ